jgi:hypothetical protein
MVIEELTKHNLNDNEILNKIEKPIYNKINKIEAYDLKLESKEKNSISKNDKLSLNNKRNITEKDKCLLLCKSIKNNKSRAEIILDINKALINEEDGGIDSLYFNDKVKMNANSNTPNKKSKLSVPKLNFEVINSADSNNDIFIKTKVVKEASVSKET